MSINHSHCKCRKIEEKSGERNVVGLLTIRIERLKREFKIDAKD